MQQQFLPQSGPAPPYNGGDGGGPQGPPQLGALPFQSSQTPPPQQSPAPLHASHDRKGSSGQYGLPSSVKPQGPPPQSAPPPQNPVFGIPLDRLYERDGLAVPAAVYQCIQAIDLFGLGVEGIYRQSGSMAHIQKLKYMFDTGTLQTNLEPRYPM